YPRAWLSSAPDKYVHWFPGTAEGQIAFAICYGNGVDGYASYLTQGIYTVNDAEAVVSSTSGDYTAPNAQWILEEATDVAIKLNDGQDGNFYATFYAPFDVTLNGATAYTATLNEEKTLASFTELGDNIPAGTAVLLKGTSASATATIATASATAGENALVGTYFSKALTDTQLALGISNGKVGFYGYSDNIGANKAYLSVEGGSARAFVIAFDDEVTSINAVNAAAQQGAVIYDLQGRRVNAAQQGIYIVNGQKVLVK
ncbi:MAG: hypothetical protein IJ786_02270, partial [Bacteroidaceae bacterium]|nr:hypothetical protein [Bacteroidaceae bacterium]